MTSTPRSETTSSPRSEPRPAWWGSFEVAEDATARWQIGPLSVYVHRRAREWRVAHLIEGGDARLAHDADVSAPAELTFARYAAVRSTSALALLPMVADRPIVSRPDLAFHLLPDEEVVVWMSVPVWLRITAGSEVAVLLDTPTQPLSDTWFGPDTTTGELCYSSRTSARLDRAELRGYAYRAILRLTVRNLARSAMSIERLKLPLPNLGLWADRDHALWTPGVTVEREPDGTMARVRISEGAPREATDAVRVSAPRAEQPNVVVRALSGWLR